MTRRRMTLIVSPPAHPDTNMQLDDALLRERDDLALRLYRWEPFGLSLGHFQKAADPAFLARLEDEEFATVRRPTGGGAILHAHELTYALVGPESAPPFSGGVEPSYRIVHDVLIDVLAQYGVHATYAAGAPTALPRSQQPFLCYDRSTALDLVVDGKKLVGSAKRRVEGRALQHGSIIHRHHPAVPSTAALEDHVTPDFNLTTFGLHFAQALANACQADLKNSHTESE